MPDVVPAPKTLLERGEKLFSPKRAAIETKIPGHRGADRINASTVFRWITRGVKTPGGVIRLEADRVGNGWRTSLEAIARFTAKLTEAALPTSEPAAAPAPRRATNTATKQLDEIPG